jgi:hypothetical protein
MGLDLWQSGLPIPGLKEKIWVAKDLFSNSIVAGWRG